MTSLKIKVLAYFLILPILLFAEDSIYREVTLEKYKLQNKIKNLILKSSEAQKNILFLEEEIKEMKLRIESIRSENLRILQSIKDNFPKFAVEIIKFKVKDSSNRNLLMLQTFKNWNFEFTRVQELSVDLIKTNESLVKSKKKLRASILSGSGLVIKINNEIEELDALQSYLRQDLESSGPDRDFFKKIGKLRRPIKNSKIIASKGFYKIPGERVYDYNEGLKFSAKRGEAVYPISDGILEGEIYVPNLGQILIVKHTENVRSFYIGVASVPGVLINDPLSPDKQFGLVKSSVVELKLRFDTESLDPSEWVKFRR